MPNDEKPTGAETDPTAVAERKTLEAKDGFPVPAFDRDDIEDLNRVNIEDLKWAAHIGALRAADANLAERILELRIANSRVDDAWLFVLRSAAEKRDAEERQANIVQGGVPEALA
jgi:hypothetical protein